MFHINFFKGVAQQRQVSGLQPYINSIQHPHFKGKLLPPQDTFGEKMKRKKKKMTNKKKKHNYCRFTAGRL